jgi:hypothetical protein
MMTIATEVTNENYLRLNKDNIQDKCSQYSSKPLKL